MQWQQNEGNYSGSTYQHQKSLTIESDLINRTIDRAFLKNICFMQKGRLLLQQGPFIEIKFEKLQVNSSMVDRYFHVINMTPIATEATSLAQK